MLLNHDEKQKVHFLNAKVNLKKYLQLSREINYNINRRVPVEMEKLRDQNEAFKSYQNSLGEYSRLLEERTTLKIAKSAAQAKNKLNQTQFLHKIKK